MLVDKDKAVEAVHKGRKIHFCAEGCKNKYFADPDAYEINYDVVAGKVAPVREMKHTAEFEGATLHFLSKENRDKFLNDPDANKLLRRDYRAPWVYPKA